MENAGEKSDTFTPPISDEALRALRESEARYQALLSNTEKELRKAREELGQQAKRFDVTLSTVNDLIIRWGRDGRILYANLIQLDLWNLKQGEEVGKELAELNYPHELREYLLEQVRRVFETGEIFRDERKYTSPTGIVSCYDYALSPAFGSNGKVEYVVSSARDISDRKRAEITIGESEERQAFLLKLSDALRPLVNPVEVQATAADLLGSHLGAHNSNYYETDADGWLTRSHGYVDGTVAVPDRFLLTDFGQQWADSLAAGHTLVVSDMATDKRFPAAERKAWRANRLCAALGVPLVKGGRLCAVFGFNSAEPRHWTKAEIALAEEVAERTWAAVESARAEAALHESEARRELSLEDANMGTFIWHVEEDRGELDARLLFLLGQPIDGALNLAEAMTLIHSDDAAGYAAAVTEATKWDGLRELRHDIRVQKPGGGWRWIAITANVSFDATGRPLRMAGTGIDVTARKRSEEHRELLINELNHRVKNTLATVQSFAHQTLRNAGNLAEARVTFESRLVALAKAHDVLTQESWEGAGLKQIVANAISAYLDDRGGQRFEIDGPELRVQPKSALALSMALHELATNAVKYGSLSNQVGRVRISWVSTQDTPPRFQLRWAESDGPPVEPPRGRGFGSRLIEQGLARELAGEVQLDFERQGLVCTIEAPLVEVAWGVTGSTL